MGATGSTTISFILPGLFFWKVSACSELPVSEILTVWVVDAKRPICKQKDECGSSWADGLWNLCVCVLVSSPAFAKGKTLRMLQPRVQYLPSYNRLNNI